MLDAVDTAPAPGISWTRTLHSGRKAPDARMSALTTWLLESIQSFLDLGWLGILLYVGIIVVAQSVMLPLSPIGVFAGLIFGLPLGFLAIEIGTLLGAALNFVVSRYVAREFVSRHLAGSPRLQLIDEAIGREGWKIIALLRFCPIPFGFANYAYGLTAVRFWPYLAASVVAILPANLFFVYFGASLKPHISKILVEGLPRHPQEYVLLLVGLGAGFAALLFVSNVARKALARTGTVVA